MTNYRAFPASNGPPLAAASGNWLLGTIFSVLGGVYWFEGYWIWVPTGGDTTARKCALWNRYSTSQQYVVAGSVINSSGTLSATPTGGESGGHWNFVPLAVPIQLAPGTLYVASIGWVATNGIPVTSAQWGSGQPLHAGIVNGPLTVWSATSGTNTFPAGTVNQGLGQQLFSNVLSADPSVDMPNNGSGNDSLGIDLQISDTAPVGYAGSWRFWPNMADVGNYSLDTANGFTLGWEFTLSSAAEIDNVWFYSPATVTVLPQKVGVFRVSDHALMFSASASSWTSLLTGSALAAGGGWGYAPLSGLLPPDTYRVAVFQNQNVIWNAAVANYTAGSGFGANGLTSGPITAPNNASAHTPGQASYNTSTVDIAYPNSNVGPFFYGVDIELTIASTSTSTITLAASASAGVANRTGTGKAAVSLGMKNLPPAPRTGVTGWDLYSTLALQADYKRYYDSLPPVACPYDGTPLKQGPASDGNVLFCPMGNFRYPEDWDPETMSGM